MIYTTPNIYRNIFKNVVWDNFENKVLLTFDDGPDEYATLDVLEVLNNYKVKAEFYISGKNILKNEHILFDIVKEGHKICNHGFHHLRSIAFSNSRLRDSILKTENILKDLNINFSKYYRPPFGFFLPHNLKMIRNLNYKIKMWSILSGDYTKTNNEIMKLISRNIKQNSIIVFHDNEITRSKIKNILKQTISQINEMGYYLNGN